jgi:GTP-binding protein Era
MNAVIGETLSVTNPKAQTTRHRIVGIWNNEDHQIVFSDTPGILEPAYRLQESMMAAVDASLKDADLVLYLIEPKEPFDEAMIEKLGKLKGKVIAVINKSDLTDQESLAARLAEVSDKLPKANVLPVSAIHRFNTKELVQLICSMLPEHPPYFDKDELTDRNVRFFVTEIIREKILQHYKKEIPYSVEVRVEEYKEEANLDRIIVSIFVERESQKMIVIGTNGRAIKRMATDARRAIENFVGKKVYLETTVKVRKDWRNSDRDLKEFGYQ